MAIPPRSYCRYGGSDLAVRNLHTCDVCCVLKYSPRRTSNEGLRTDSDDQPFGVVGWVPTPCPDGSTTDCRPYQPLNVWVSRSHVTFGKNKTVVLVAPPLCESGPGDG